MNRWLPVVGGVCMNLALGSLYAWSVFVLPLEQEFGWSRAETSWTFTIAIVTFAASFVWAGRIQDMRGPRICAVIGGVLVGAGFVLSSFTTSLWQLYVMFGLIVGLGNGFGYATPVPVASKWFPDKRSLIVGIMVGGYGAGSAIFGPVATSLIGSIGWRATFQILGALFFVMGMIGAWLLENPPAGYVPAGWTPAQAGAAAQSGKREYAPSEMVRTRTFWLLWVAYSLGVTGGIDGHQPAGAVRAGRRTQRRGCGVRDYHRRGWQCWWQDPVRVVVGCPGPADNPSRNGLGVGLRDARPVHLSRECVVALRARDGCLLVLWHAAFGVCVDDGRSFRDAQSGRELRVAIQRLGRGWSCWTLHRRPGVRCIR